MLLPLLFACGTGSKTNSEEGPLVIISTELGDIQIRLYNETPLHRDNFLKLVKEGYYDGLLFHRVIKNFMIQGGDPDSRGAAAEVKLGNGGPGYTLEAEIKPGLFHKKGALAAARTSDQVNPERRSSGSQFYIVQGEVFTPEKLATIVERKNYEKAGKIFRHMYQEKADSIRTLQQEGKQEEFTQMLERLENEAKVIADNEKYTFSDEQKAAYTTLGGTPHLDGAYTVFGEVVKGMEVIDAIANAQTNPDDRPLKDLVMEMEIID